MAAAEEENPCCAGWKDKYKKTVEKRNALRKAVDLLKTHAVTVQISLDKVKAEGEASRASLESELSALKSEISSLRQSGGDGGGEHFRVEIGRLEELLRKEKARADSAAAEKRKAVEALKREADEARSKAQADKEVRVSLTNEISAFKSKVLSLSQNSENGVKHSKKEISELEKMVKKERSRADSAEAEKKRAVEELKREANELKSRLVSETRKVEEGNRKLETLMQKGAGERKRIDAERVKAEEHRKVAELNRKKAAEEKQRSDQLLRTLGECKREVEELRKERNALLSAKKVAESTVVLPSKEINVEVGEIKLLKKQLKFEKTRVKHAKEVAKLERSRNGIVQQELTRLKSEFALFSQRLNALGHCFSPSTEDIDEQLEKGRNIVATGKVERKLFESSANNSKEVNFPSGQLVSSQEIGALSGTTSAKILDENVSIEPTISSLSDKGAQAGGNVNMAVVAENNVRSSLRVDDVGGTSHGLGKKRKRTLDVVESIENLYSRSKKCHVLIEEKLSVLHGMMNGNTDIVKEGRSVVPKPQCDTYSKHAKLKKKKASHNRTEKDKAKDKLVMQHSRDGDERRKTQNCEKKYAHAAEQVHAPVSNFIGTNHTRWEGVTDSVKRNQEAMVTFEDFVDGDYIKFLNLDNSVDEEYYRAAREAPMTPTLPDIEYNVSRTSLGPSVEMNEIPTDSSKKLQDKGICGDVEGPNIHISGVNEVKFPSERKNILQHDSIPGHFVVFADSMNHISIPRIFSATRNCINRCLLGSERDWALQKILLALDMEENILDEDKICVFFSLLLLNFSVVAEKKFQNSLCGKLCLESFAAHFCSVMSDVEKKSLLSKHCCLDKLLSFIEDFLVFGRVMVHKDISSETFSGCDSRVSFLLDGVNTVLSAETASKDHFVAGSIILATICTSVDHIGFLCEASYKISRMLRHNLSLMLPILHVFAYLGGEKYFSLSNYSSITTVLKSIVTLVERPSPAAASCLPFLSKIHAEFHPCAKCPFAEDAVSVDTATSLLLEKLKNNVLTDDMDPTLKITQFNSFVDEAFCEVIDVLSLVELIASNMSWDWICIHITPQLLEMLESGAPDNFVAAVATVLGQLGKLGINTGGYEDEGVENLRCKLCAFLCQDRTLKRGLPTQVATFTALIGLLCLDFQELIHSSEKLPANASQHVPADLLRRWFSLLNKEQQELTSSILQSAGVTKERSFPNCSARFLVSASIL